MWTQVYCINTLSRGNLLCPNEFRVILWEPTNVKLLERWALRPGRVAAIMDGKEISVTDITNQQMIKWVTDEYLHVTLWLDF